MPRVGIVNPVLAAARSEGLCSMQINLPSSRVRLRHEIKSHPDTYLLDSDGAASVCRMCWGEEDEDEGEINKKITTLKIDVPLFCNLWHRS